MWVLSIDIGDLSRLEKFKPDLRGAESKRGPDMKSGLGFKFLGATETAKIRKTYITKC